MHLAETPGQNYALKSALSIRLKMTDRRSTLNILESAFGVLDTITNTAGAAVQPGLPVHVKLLALMNPVQTGYFGLATDAYEITKNRDDNLRARIALLENDPTAFVSPFTSAADEA